MVSSNISLLTFSHNAVQPLTEWWSRVQAPFQRLSAWREHGVKYLTWRPRISALAINTIEYSPTMKRDPLRIRLSRTISIPEFSLLMLLFGESPRWTRWTNLTMIKYPDCLIVPPVSLQVSRSENGFPHVVHTWSIKLLWIKSKNCLAIEAGRVMTRSSWP
jgi:hypothetical protein